VIAPYERVNLNTLNSHGMLLNSGIVPQKGESRSSVALVASPRRLA
jgi:hypothetical protein